jgi:hypothetical protein
MQDVKVEKVSSEDSLKVSENDDGSFAIEWDPNDPRYVIFNDMTEEQITELIIQGLRERIEGFDDD